MKNILILTKVLLLTVLFSCQENVGVEDTIFDDNSEVIIKNASNNKKKSKYEFLALSKPDRHWCCNIDDCDEPAHDCFPDIVVTAEKQQYIDELDLDIINNTVDDFFDEINGNYEELFPGLYGQALYDLQNNIVTLRKKTINSNTIIYHAVMVNDTNMAPSYSNSYNWGDEQVPCEEDSCGNNYISR